MFDISFWEIALVVIVALLVIGPERLPQVAQKVGQTIARIRRLWIKLKKDSLQKLDDET